MRPHSSSGPACRFAVAGARASTGPSLADLADVEILFLSASEIVGQLATGQAHFGVTGEDLVREGVAHAETAVVSVTGLGFGYANVVVAVPQAWIDVAAMADLDEVAVDFRVRHGRRLRVATKYANLTRGFFAEHGLADYRIVESLGATEGAPASGLADLIVDITTTGATLAANGLKVLDDGVVLRSEANLMASLRAPWDARRRELARLVLARIAAEEEARTTREVRAGIDPAALHLAELAARFEARVPEGRGGAGEAVLHCPAAKVFDLAEALVAAGAGDVTVAALDYVFRSSSPMTDRLFARIDSAHR
jgi:ATP phosphoribosyltransferase